jgi:hypothetical protein
VLAFEAAWDDESAERDAQLAALDDDHLYALVAACDDLRLVARALWVERTTRPRSEP